MSDNLPAVREERAPVRVDTDSWVAIAGDVIKLANVISGTDFVPEALRDSAPATAAAMLYGREIGLGPMTSLQSTHVIKGKPGISAEIMRALILADGHQIEFVETTSARCVMRGRRRGEDTWTTVEWTLDMARQAGLLSKDNWKGYPQDQLVARASSTLAKRKFPDVIHGFASLEELHDLDAEPATDTPAGPGTRVTRARKTTARKSTPAPLEERGERPALTGPPLPGEDGYETSAGDGAPGTGAGSEPTTSPADAQTTDTTTSVGDGAHDEEQPETSPTGTEEPPGESEGETPKPGGSKEPPPRNMSRAQQRGIEAALTHIGVDNDRDERHLIATTILGRVVESSLTFDEASTLIETFARIETKEQLSALLDEFDARRTAEADRWNEGDRS